MINLACRLQIGDIHQCTTIDYEYSLVGETGIRINVKRTCTCGRKLNRRERNHCDRCGQSMSYPQIPETVYADARRWAAEQRSVTG